VIAIGQCQNRSTIGRGNGREENEGKKKKKEEREEASVR
jgi:hypothetical protein